MKRGTPEHPKVYDLCDRLKVRRPTAVGYLEMLWHFTAKYAPRGDIGRFPDKRIEAALDWSGTAGRLVSALCEAGWIDRDREHRLLVHDWPDHADDTVKKRLGRADLKFATVTEKVTGHAPVTDGKVPASQPDNGSPPEPEPFRSPAQPEPSPSRVPIELGNLLPLRIDDDGIATLWRECRRAASNCTPEEVAQAARVKLRQVGQLKNPAGLIITAVPLMFAGTDGFHLRLRRERARQAEEERQVQEASRRELEQLEQDPNVPEEERQWAKTLLRGVA